MLSGKLQWPVGLKGGSGKLLRCELIISWYPIFENCEVGITTTVIYSFATFFTGERFERILNVIMVMMLSAATAPNMFSNKLYLPEILYHGTVVLRQTENLARMKPCLNHSTYTLLNCTRHASWNVAISRLNLPIGQFEVAWEGKHKTTGVNDSAMFLKHASILHVGADDSRAVATLRLGVFSFSSLHLGSP
jgi:hypothetical protein